MDEMVSNVCNRFTTGRELVFCFPSLLDWQEWRELHRKIFGFECRSAAQGLNNYGHGHSWSYDFQNSFRKSVMTALE